MFLFDVFDVFDVLMFGLRMPGKSTTLGILSGDVSPTQGNASIAGHDILTEQVLLIPHLITPFPTVN